MDGFNSNSRTKNALRTSFVGTLVYFIKLGFSFGYRTVFLLILTKDYLGINGLFTSVLRVLSLAELGISSAIIYRFYDPINKGDVNRVGELINFFRKVYKRIAVTILALGIILLPFINHFIKDASEIPGDINIYVVYILFLLETVSSYFFSYKLTLLSADQKEYINTIINLLCVVVQNTVKIAILFLTKKYIFTLAAGILTTILTNYYASRYVEKTYKNVFAVKRTISIDDQKEIFNDTFACMCHKVGTVVLTSIDNLVLTKMISLSTTGLYSNYALLVSNVQLLFQKIFGNFSANIGNARNNMSKENYYALFKRINFISMWFSSVFTVCLFTILDDFIFLWLGRDYVMTSLTSSLIAIQMYLFLLRIPRDGFIDADGLFVKDKIRPLIESTINIMFSIILTKKIGIAGVFLGTIISSLATVQWREIYILYKYAFKKSSNEYWKKYFIFGMITLVSFLLISIIKEALIDNVTFIVLLIEGLASFALINVLLLIFFYNDENLQYVITTFKRLAINILHRIK